MQPTHAPLSALALVAALPVALAAQGTIVSPSGWAAIESPGGNAFPFGATSLQRYVNVHDDLAGTARVFTAMALRRSGTTSTTVTPATSIVVDGFFSTAVVTGATVDATFDNNHGGDKTQVWTQRTISFPQAPTGLLPYPFLYHLPLDTPFPFGGAGPLCWEVRITARPQSASTFHDYVSGASGDPEMVVSRHGDGCIASGRTDPFALTGASSNDWPNGTGTLSATASNGPANANAAYLFGLAALPVSIPLPFTTGSPSGTCYLHADAPFAIPGTLSSTGGFTFRVPLPLQPQFHGVHLVGQAAAPDTNNALGWVTSNATDHQVVAPFGAPPGGRVYASSATATTGTLGPGQSLVVQFHHQ